MNYYNEFDPYAAQWLRNLIEAGHLPNGEVDSRSIKDVKASELAGFVQCHFFAGLGGWSHALHLAGWPEDRPVWTGSCPCQPFSAAGAGGGVTDERHLWPVWFNLIRECRPRVVFGEQVEAAINHGWLDLVQSDLESEGYACGAAGIPAAGVGAPHIRQRLYFVADPLSARRPEGWPVTRDRPLTGRRSACRVGDTDYAGLEGRRLSAERARELFAGAPGVASHWGDADWIRCSDEKYRAVESGTFPLAYGAPARVGRLRAYGNAIVPQVAQVFIEAYLES